MALISKTNPSVPYQNLNHPTIDAALRTLRLAVEIPVVKLERNAVRATSIAATLGTSAVPTSLADVCDIHDNLNGRLTCSVRLPCGVILHRWK